MKKHLGVAALLAATIVLTGCTQQESEWKGESDGKQDWGTSNYWEEKEAAKEWEDISKAIAKGPEVRVPNGRDESCLKTLNFIGAGNPGTKNDVLTSTFNAIKEQVVKEVEGIDPALVTLAIPLYDGSDMTTPKHFHLADGSLDAAKANAATAIAAAVRNAQDKCAGSKTILLANGFGSSIIHEAESKMTPIASRSVMGMVLVNDPNRARSDRTDVLTVGNAPTDVSSPNVASIVKLSEPITSKIGYDGIAGGEKFNPVLLDRILSVCAPSDSICNNDPEIPMGTVMMPGQQIVMNIALSEKVYADPKITSIVAGWVTEKAKIALKDAAKVRDTYADLTEYLKYVNHNNKGAKVVQDAPLPSVIATCEADYAVFATRGSGENIEGNNNTEYRETIDNSVGYKGGQPAQPDAPVLQGLTRFPATLAWEIASKLPIDKKIRFIPVNYYAVPIPGLPLPKIGNNTTTIFDYEASVAQGVEQLTSDISKFQEACPDTPIILIGYSQGSQVTHTALGKLPQTATAQIKTVLLIADPLMNSAMPNNGIEYDPTTDGGKGKFKKYPLALGISTGAHNVSLPDYLGQKIIQICDKDDPVCLTSGDNLVRSMDVHSNAYSNESHYVAPANFAVEKLTGRKLLTDQQWSDIESQRTLAIPGVNKR